jgi:hypothetical protein
MSVRNPFASDYQHLKSKRQPWFTKKKIVLLGVILGVLIIALAVGLGVGLSRSKSSDDNGETSPSTNGTTTPTTPTGNGTWWKPQAGTTWQIDLSDNYTSTSTLDNVQAYDIDLFNNPLDTMQHVRSSGIKLICYFSAGSYENWRPDANEFPSSVLGSPLSGWEGERWLDTNSPTVRNIMIQRLQLAKNKSCDAVDPDNIDAYDNDNGLDLTEDDAVNYVTFLASEAHNLGMGVSLKNGRAIVNRTVDLVDFQVNEQCVQYNECSKFETFINQDKPVFHIEYPDSTRGNLTAQEVCQESPSGFSTLIKDMNLDSWYEYCNGTALIVPATQN